MQLLMKVSVGLLSTLMPLSMTVFNTINDDMDVISGADENEDSASVDEWLQNCSCAIYQCLLNIDNFLLQWLSWNGDTF